MGYTANYLDVMLVISVTAIAIAYLIISDEWRKF